MNGKAHLTTNVLIGVSAISFFVLEGADSNLVAAAAIGAIAGCAITPDYDLQNNLPKAIIGKVPIVGWLWRLFWTPYYKLLRHRGLFSHSPFFSTAIRFVYLVGGSTFILFLFDLIAASSFAQGFTEWLGDVGFEFWLVVFGVWCAQDLSHLLLDSKIFRIFKRS